MPNSLDSAPALIFIPDITGFTAYISKTDIRIAKRIIPELLQTLIDSNVLGLRQVEIQGDAILYYKIGEPPQPTDLLGQAKHIYQEFTKKLESLSENYPNTQMSLPDRLGIKILVHFGKIAITRIQGQEKLIGEDVIIAHRLLKNSIKSDEYLLLTENYLRQFSDEEIEAAFSFGTLQIGQEHYEHIGEVNYRYTSLKPLVAR